MTALFAFTLRLATADKTSSDLLRQRPAFLDERRRLLDAAVRGQQSAAFVVEHEPLGFQAFGQLWSATETDWRLASATSAG